MEGLKRVSIQGKPYPVFYGMYGFARIMKSTGLRLNEVLAKTQEFANLENISGENLMFLYDFIHAGFITGARMENKEFPFNVEQLSAYLPLSGKEIETVFVAFMESMPQMDEDDQKKAEPAPAKEKQIV